MKPLSWITILILFIVVSSMLPLAFTEAVRADEGKSSLGELTNLADSIIVGTVVERSSYWNDEHTGIYTSASLSVEERLKGTASQDRVTITLPGGEVGGMGEWVSDMPSFEQGERTIVFLKKLSKAQLPKAKAFKGQLPEEQFEVFGGFRGKFAIKQGRVDNLPESKFRERVRKVAQGQTLPEGELYVPSSTATFPYSYAGFCWPHPPNPVVGYRINQNTTDCTGEGAAVQTAAATWSVPANFSFSYAGTSTATTYSYNGINEVLWRNFGSGGTIAHALIWYSGSTILENDIEFNDYYAWSTSTSCPSGYYDVESIGLHELGHWLCLDDLYNPPDAAKVMYGYGSTGTTKRALHADDITGIQFIYGASNPSSTQKLVGADDATGTQDGANYILLTKFQAVATGQITEFKVKSGATGQAKVAIYANSSGEPGARLSYNDTAQNVVAGWNTLSIPALNVTSGTYYWLGVNVSVNNAVQWITGSSSNFRYKAATFSTFTWPDPAGTGYSSSSARQNLLLAGEQRAQYRFPSPPRRFPMPQSALATHRPFRLPVAAEATAGL